MCKNFISTLFVLAQFTEKQKIPITTESGGNKMWKWAEFDPLLSDFSVSGHFLSFENVLRTKNVE